MPINSLAEWLRKIRSCSWPLGFFYPVLKIGLYGPPIHGHMVFISLCVYTRKGEILYIFVVKSWLHCISIWGQNTKKKHKTNVMLLFSAGSQKEEIGKLKPTSLPKRKKNLSVCIWEGEQEWGFSWTPCWIHRAKSWDRIAQLANCFGWSPCSLRSNSFPVFGQDREKLGTYKFDVAFD